MNERINILFASDINYAPYYGVLMTSLFINNPQSEFDIYLITDNSWTRKENEKFERLCKKYNSRFVVRIVEDEEIIKSFPVAGHLNKATYYNLNVTNLLPESVHRIIYMDGDMIVNGDIRPLWGMDLKGNLCAMALAPAWSFGYVYDRLGYDGKYGYYNNGTTLYDIDALRTFDFSNKAFDYIQANEEKLTMMDQDVTNTLLHDRIHPLSIRYNFQSKFFWKSYWQTYSNQFKQELVESAKDPIIIHYSDFRKPWQLAYQGWPLTDLWNKYYRLSQWRGIKQLGPWKDVLKRFLKPSQKRDTFTEKALSLF